MATKRHHQLLAPLLLLPLLLTLTKSEPEKPCWRTGEEILADASQFSTRHASLFGHYNLHRFTKRQLKPHTHPRLIHTPEDYRLQITYLAQALRERTHKSAWPHLLHNMAIHRDMLLRTVDQLENPLPSDEVSAYDGRAPGDSPGAFADYQTSLRPLSAAVNNMSPTSITALPLCAVWSHVSAISRRRFLPTNSLAKCIRATVVTSTILLAHHARVCTLHRGECRVSPLSHDRVQIAQSLALAYDLLHADMTHAERRTVRSALVLLVVQHVRDENVMVSTRFLRDAGMYLAQIATATELDDLDEYTTAILAGTNAAKKFDKRNLHAFASRMQTAVMRTTRVFDTVLREGAVMFLNVVDEAVLPLLAAQRRGADIFTSQAFRNAAFIALQTSVPWTCQQTVVTRTEDGPEERDMALAPTFMAVMARVFSDGVLPTMLWRSVAKAYLSTSGSSCVLQRRHVLPLTLLIGTGPPHDFKADELLNTHTGTNALPLSLFTADGGHFVARDGFADRSAVLSLSIDPHCCGKTSDFQSAFVSLLLSGQSRLKLPTEIDAIAPAMTASSQRMCDRISHASDDNHITLLAIETALCQPSVENRADSPRTLTRTLAFLRDSTSGSVLLTSVNRPGASLEPLTARIDLGADMHVAQQECRGRMCHVILLTADGQVTFMHIASDQTVHFKNAAHSSTNRSILVSTRAQTLWYALHARRSDDISLVSRGRTARLKVASRLAEFSIGAEGRMDRSESTRCDRLVVLSRDEPVILTGKTLMTDQADSSRLSATVGIRAEGDAHFDDVVSACGDGTNARVSYTILDCSDGRQNGAVDPARAKCTRIDDRTHGCEGDTGGESWNRGLRNGHVYVVRVHVERLDDDVGDTEVRVSVRHLLKYHSAGLEDGGAAVVRSIDASGRQVGRALRQDVRQGVAARQEIRRRASRPSGLAAPLQSSETRPEVDPLWASRASRASSRSASLDGVCSAAAGSGANGVSVCSQESL